MTTTKTDYTLRNILCITRSLLKHKELEMWADAQRDGHPAECRWRPLFNTAKFGWCPQCRAV